MFLFFSIFFFKPYRYVWNELVVRSQSYIIRNRKNSIAMKRQTKLGRDFNYIELILRATPDTAVILMPSDDELFPENVKSVFNKSTAAGLKNKAWSTYFLYPRKLVYEKEPDNPDMAQIDYVCIVNGLGYHKLKYELDKKYNFAVLPVDPAKLNK
ncbi:MAG: hypothetical protein JXQ65_05560 [Candidatus Marinimicrobia bacterium]|nr:hypothetical protein [Candidatus Neomarinimicrobiota bacterium]